MPLSVKNRPIDQKKDEGTRKKKEGGGTERGRKRGRRCFLSLSRMKADGRTKFLYESREKTFIRSVLMKGGDGERE